MKITGKNFKKISNYLFKRKITYTADIDSPGIDYNKKRVIFTLMGIGLSLLLITILAYY